MDEDRDGADTRTGGRGDLVTVAAVVALIAAAHLIGLGFEPVPDSGVHWPPLSARLRPHLGLTTPLAVAIAAAVIGWGPRLASRLRWRVVLAATWLVAVTWTVALALADGWDRGFAGQLTSDNEYLSVIGRFGDIGAALRGYADHILLDAPDNWPAHVAGHPPGAVLTFVGLDRIGLGGGAWAAWWCVLVGCSALLAILVTVRALAGEESARRAAPFLALAPAAVWIGVSADAYFAAVAAWAIALLVLAATRRCRWPRLTAAAAGLLFGAAVYLSYGLTLLVVAGVAVLFITRTARVLPYVLAGALVVPAAFTLAGFYWWEAYFLLTERYDQGAGGVRFYGYWVWANLAAAALVVGPAVWAGLRRLLRSVPSLIRRPGERDGHRLAWLLLAFVAVIAIADLSGMSKAETERIWLPFTLWLLPAAALLPGRHRPWLAAQALVALAVNHLLLTSW